jgi:hypothetical protein
MSRSLATLAPDFGLLQSSPPLRHAHRRDERASRSPSAEPGPLYEELLAAKGRPR